jgi:hypothetical protein
VSDKPTNGNGNHTTIIQAGVKLGSQIVHSIGPPQFIALILLNVIFIGMLFWFVDGRARHTAEMISQLMSKCLRAMP